MTPTPAPTLVTIPGSGGTTPLASDLYAPSGTAMTGLIVLAYGTDGFIDNERGNWKAMISGYAEDLAKQGLFALIPRYFDRTKTPDGGAAFALMGQGRADWASALVDSVTYGRTIPRVDSARIGLLGFSLGGYLCLRIRAAAKPRALVEYFAPKMDGIGPAGQVPFAQIHHGKQDTMMGTGVGNASAIKAILEREKTAVEKFEYDGAGHGFAGTDKANTDAAAQSKTRTLAFFAARL